MRKLLFALGVVLIFPVSIYSQPAIDRQVDNLTAFAKLYGYIKYFHPSDEASSIDWDKFAVYGTRIVLSAKDDVDLIQKLADLFTPIAPSLIIYTNTNKKDFDINSITPPDKKGYKNVTWQHFGVALGFTDKVYRSKRTNREANLDAKEALEFKIVPTPGEVIQKDILKNITVIVPLALYGNQHSTWPEGDKNKLEALKLQLVNETGASADDIAVRVADVIITWNIFRHFFPYWEDASMDAATILHNALQKSINDNGATDFFQTLRLMMVPLNDGHIGVSLIKPGDSTHYYTLPLLVDWVENKLVVDKVLDSSLLTKIAVGDVIVSIDSTDAASYLQKREKYISGSTQLKIARALPSLFISAGNGSVVLQIQHQSVITINLLKRNMPVRDLYIARDKRMASGPVRNGIYYVDINSWPMDSINAHMDDLKNARSIVCDLRGYPNSNQSFIAHLLKDDEDTKWIFVPRVIYPDYEKVTYAEQGWHLRTKKPHLTAKIIFITDGRAISFAESYMGFIKDFKLATIVGQPTAGTNGNINILHLPGGYQISFTGMLVKNHDGSKHHLRGIVPDVLVERTIKGIAAGKDELLEKAIELAAQEQTN